MKEQRCLYCERPLALLNRLTGDGEFCSKDHRRIYQKEHSQLALARLLQAQPAGPAAPAYRRSAESSESPSRWQDTESAPLESRLPQAPAAVVERLAPKPRSKDPQAAKFSETPEMEPVDWTMESPRGLETRWSELPRRLVCGQDAFPRFVNFVAPGSFLRRQSQPAVPNVYPGNLKRGGVAPAAFSGIAQTRFFEERLRRTERIGFCPP